MSDQRHATALYREPGWSPTGPYFVIRRAPLQRQVAGRRLRRQTSVVGGCGASRAQVEDPREGRNRQKYVVVYEFLTIP